MIIDYSTWRPSMTTLQHNGVTAAGRYIGWDGQPGFQSIGKNLTMAEAKQLHDAGIAVFVSFEYAADAALNGAPQGAKDAQLAGEQLHNLGAPHGMAIYWAIDFDIKDFAPNSSDPARKLGPAADYFHAINAEKIPYATGVYGGYYAVQRAMDAGLATMGWQTVAWSGGQWYAKAVLRQLASQFMGTADVNLHASAADDFGQWPRPAQPSQWETWTGDGSTTLTQLGHDHGGMAPSHILRTTAQHAWPWGRKFDATTAAWIDNVLGPTIVPAGAKLRVKR